VDGFELELEAYLDESIFIGALSAGTAAIHLGLLLLGVSKGDVVLVQTHTIIPPNFFDNGQTTCLSLLLFDKPCFACGMTRAIQHLIHLDFNSAYNFNKISFLVFPILIIFWIKEFLKILKKRNFKNS
jgi:hypothetical protein